MARNPMDGDDYGDDDGDDGDMQPHAPAANARTIISRAWTTSGTTATAARRTRAGTAATATITATTINNNRNDRNDRGGDRNEPRFDRGGGEPNGGQQPPRPQNAEQAWRAAVRAVAGGEQFRRRDRFPQQQHEQPEFLRRPVRRPRREGGNGAPEEVNGAAGCRRDRPRLRPRRLDVFLPTA